MGTFVHKSFEANRNLAGDRNLSEESPFSTPSTPSSGNGEMHFLSFLFSWGQSEESPFSTPSSENGEMHFLSFFV